MISATYFKILDDAHRELAARFERLEKARANRDAEGIKRAEMHYFHALQQVCIPRWRTLLLSREQENERH